MPDATQSLKKTDQGLEVPLGPGQYTELKVRRTQLSYYDLKAREIIRQSSRDLEVIFPQVQRQTERPIAHFKLMDGERERCRDSVPLGEKKIPIREVQRAFRGLDALEQKGKEKDAARDAKSVIQDLRLPDPKVNPELYRCWGPRYQRRLVILWGCERPPGSSIPAKQAIGKLKTEPNWAGTAHLAAKATSALVAVAAVFFALKFIAYLIVDDSLDLRQPRFVSQPVSGGSLEIAAPSKGDGSSPGVLTSSPVLLTIRDVQGDFNFGFPGVGRVNLQKGANHFTAFVRAGEYELHDPHGKELTLRVRDVWGTTGKPEPIRASLIINKRRISTNEDLEISLEPSFPRDSITRYEWAWAQVPTGGNSRGDESEERFQKLDEKLPRTKHRFEKPGRYYIFGAVQGNFGKSNCVVDVVEVESALTTAQNSRASEKSAPPHFQPPAAVILPASGGNVRVVTFGEPSQCWLDGESKPIFSIKGNDESLPLTILGKKADSKKADGLIPRLDTTVSLSDLRNATFKLGDFINLRNKLVVTEELERGEPQFFTPLQVREADGLSIVKVLPTMKFADKCGYLLRAVPQAPVVFHDVKWKFKGPSGEKSWTDTAEVVFFGVAGRYTIHVDAAVTGSEKQIHADAEVTLDHPTDMSPLVRFLCWLAR